MELPAGLAQDYIAVAGIAAIYVASSSSGCRIDVTRDLKRTQTMLRKQDHDLTIESAVWASDPETAGKIARRANETIHSSELRGGVPLAEADATAQIKAAAASMKIHLTSHAAVLERVEAAATHINTTLRQAQRNGGLRWFNQAFRDFRLRTKACGRPALSYNQAWARLRRVIVRCILAGERPRLGAEILPLVFPELSQ